ncbi:hypothetical protein [Subtercola boreus]|uniref:hypothetical protein n=1 Tax=Subtercola boreus TaxID=120213 RepID=UPI001175B6D0|nr:hypothetical protein [Subtercola boreus]TQL55931.1 hypothetical protein FB464_3505 [Subtercola boreus]
MSATPDPPADLPESSDDLQQATIRARPLAQAFPFTDDPEYGRVVDDLEWGLF